MLTLEEYKKNYERSIHDTDLYVTESATEMLHWDQMFTMGYDTTSEKYFKNGRLNACYNAVDRHVNKHPNKTAFIVLDNVNLCTKITYKELYDDILKKAYVFSNLGLTKGDVVTFYGNNSADFFASVLACGRLGLVSHFVFGGFSADVIAERLIDTKTKLILTYGIARRGEKSTNYFDIVHNATKKVNYAGHVIVFGDNNLKWTTEKILLWSTLKKSGYKHTRCIDAESDAPLIIIFTSGSSGKSKGIVHGTGGFLYGTMMSMKLSFGFNGSTDVFLSTADIGWMACVSHSIYGPLLCGGTTVVFEGMPFYPSHMRIFDVISMYKVTHLYTAPTVVRMLRKFMTEDNLTLADFKRQYDISALQVIGSVGEILSEGLTSFCRQLVRSDIPIINTYWQTESGTIMLSTLPIINSKQVGAGYPLYFVKPRIVKVDPVLHTVVDCSINEKGLLLFSGKWPSLAVTLLNDHTRYNNTYFNVVPGYYYTGDEAVKDGSGCVHILGRVDDVINVSGHRISTLEIEDKLSTCENIAEFAVVGIPDAITGHKICVNAVSTRGYNKEKLEKDIRNILSKGFGKVLGRYEVRFYQDLPKTRSGKFLRRVLRAANSKLCETTVSTVD